VKFTFKRHGNFPVVQHRPLERRPKEGLRFTSGILNEESSTIKWIPDVVMHKLGSAYTKTVSSRPIGTNGQLTDIKARWSPQVNLRAS